MAALRRSAFTIVELLVVIAIIGILVSMLLPAINSAREAARRTQCIGQMSQIALALNMVHDTTGAYPPARFESHADDLEKCGNGWEPTWFVRVLPFMEQDAIYDEWQIYKPWNEQTELARASVLSIFLCPSRRDEQRGLTGRDVSTEGYEQFVAGCGCVYTWTTSETERFHAMASDYAGNHGDLSPGAFGAPSDFYYGGNGTGVIVSSRPECAAEEVVGWLDKVSDKHIKDGLSKTFLFGEKHIPESLIQQWPDDGPAYDGDFLPSSSRVAGAGAPLARGPHDQDGRVLSFGSAHPQVCNFAFVDGSVRSMEVETSTRTLALFSHRNNSSLLLAP